MNHIFFGCLMAKLIWGIAKEVFHLVTYPRSVDHFSGVWLQGKGLLPVKLLMFVFAGFSWAIWTTGNKMAIEKRSPRAPTDVVYVALTLLQKWSIMLKEVDGERILSVKEEVLQWKKSFKPSVVELSDIGEN